MYKWQFVTFFFMDKFPDKSYKIVTFEFKFLIIVIERRKIAGYIIFDKFKFTYGRIYYDIEMEIIFKHIRL